ncbi:P-loop containing nucleoside triphosphate hydrolase protein [Xylaria intraflava]|nr:P-loop containing nucleoside triphosphate hydrolase protein [Xylaria intraflava]
MVVSFNTVVLNGMCSKDQLELLDAVDRLRLQGIDHFISLPQIIVCGDQSSGKSSVLEAISGVPFPVKSNLCTRFPTELILRRAPDTGAKVTIIPDGQHEKSFLPEELHSFDGLPEVIEAAKVHMGVSMQGKGFSKDLLRIEISGPTHPHLTIVDLPGLIHSETKQQSASDVKLVKDVVKTYMDKKRSIMLAVISAKNDFANQIVLKLARAADPPGKRTLGVITKPDTLIPGSGSEAMFLSLAQNKEFEFHLGWHVLKNLDSEKVERSSLLHLRNDEEEKFFADGIWQQLSPSMLGVKELRPRLSDLLLRQIATELPSLIKEIDIKLSECQMALSMLGKPHVTVEEQRLCLVQLSQKFQVLLKAATDGTYNDPFFEHVESNRGRDQRLRAVVQNLNTTFAEKLERVGHKRTLVDSSLDSESQSTNTDQITRDQFIEAIQKIMKRTRGCELPGLFNSVVVADLFREQSAPWKQIVLRHMASVWNAVKRFLKLLVTSIADEAVSKGILSKLIYPELATLRQTIDAKAVELIESQALCHPMTYNKQYFEEIQRLGKARRTQQYNKIIETMPSERTCRHCSNWNTAGKAEVVDRLSTLADTDISRNAASEALDCMNAFYNVAMKRFVDDVAIEVIERKLMAVLPDILSPVKALTMSPAMMAAIVGESHETQSVRLKLDKQLEVLNKGSQTCRRFIDLRLGGDFVPTAEEHEEMNDSVTDYPMDKAIEVEEPIESHPDA